MPCRSRLLVWEIIGAAGNTLNKERLIHVHCMCSKSWSILVHAITVKLLKSLNREDDLQHTGTMQLQVSNF